VPGPPAHIVSRRERRRAQLRRQRRLAALGALLALVAVLAVVLVATGNGATSRSRVPGSTVPESHSAAGRSTRPPAGISAARQAADPAAVERLIRLGLPIYCAGRRGRAVAFTFDDGPGPYTHYALKKLREAGERATFFAVGRSIDNYPGRLPRELKLGVIGDHTYTHPMLTQMPAATVYSEISRTAAKIQAQVGQRVDLFRPPYGARNPAVDHIVHSLGLLEVLWTSDSADSLGANSARIIRNVETGLHPGAIILMHENRGQTIRALTTLLPELHRRNLRSVTVPELLRSDPPSLAHVRAGRGGCGKAGVVLRGSPS
jgi:peptidoglycan/xylan/chitin deacetylase (PgdA/CDA1 family)